MSATLLPLFVVLSVFGLASLGAAWWHQRRYIQHLQMQLVHNDQSRRALAEQLLALRQQIDAGAVPDLDQRRRDLDRLLAAAAPAEDRDWLPTQPAEAATH